MACDAPANYVLNSNDCNDFDNSINPNATEILDEIDQNCFNDPFNFIYRFFQKRSCKL